MTETTDNNPNPLEEIVENPLGNGPADMEEASGMVDDDTAAEVTRLAKEAASGKPQDPFGEDEPEVERTEEPVEDPTPEEPKEEKPELDPTISAKLAELEELKGVVENIENDPELMAMLEDYYAKKAGTTQQQTTTTDSTQQTPEAITQVQQQVQQLQAQLAVEQFFGTNPEAQPYRKTMAEIADKNPGIQDLNLLLKLARTQQGEESSRSLQSAEKGSAAPRRGHSTTIEELGELIEKSNTNDLERLARKAAETIWKQG